MMRRRASAAVLAGIATLLLQIGGGVVPVRAAAVSYGAQLPEFRSLVSAVMPSPTDSSVLVQFADGAAEVVSAGRVLRTLPASIGSGATWVPGSPWILSHSLPSAGAPTAYYVTPVERGATRTLPACLAGGSVQALPPSEVAGWCGGDLQIMQLPVTGRAVAAGDIGLARRRLPVTPAGRPVFAINASASLVAVDTTSGVRVIGLEGQVIPGAFQAVGKPVEMIWSDDGTLAMVGRSAVYMWRPQPPHTGWRRFNLGDVRMARWLPGSAGLLVLVQRNPDVAPPTYALEVVPFRGTIRTLMRGRLGYVVGLSPDGSTLWREEGVAPTVYDHPAQPGPGPFSLMPVAVRLTAVTPPTSACGPTRGSTIPLPTVADGSSAPPVELQVVHMVTATTGWAEGATGILHTVDGGRLWEIVSPKAWNQPTDFVETSQFVDAKTAWVKLQFPPAGASKSQLLFVTSDAGQTWTGVSLPVNSGDILFADAARGWVLSKTAPVRIFATGDGGVTWRLVSAGALPLPAGAEIRASFTLTSGDWATMWFPQRAGATYRAGATFGVDTLFVSRDGGIHWSRVTLPPVTGLSPSQLFDVSVPKFFTPAVGELVADYGDGAQTPMSQVIYRTNDGGVTWSPSTPVVSDSQLEGELIAACHAWMTGAGTVYLTADGGAHWTAHVPNVDLSWMRQVSFVSPLLGWITVSDPQNTNFSRVIETIDGGIQWTDIGAQIAG